MVLVDVSAVIVSLWVMIEHRKNLLMARGSLLFSMIWFQNQHELSSKDMEFQQSCKKKTTYLSKESVASIAVFTFELHRCGSAGSA